MTDNTITVEIYDYFQLPFEAKKLAYNYWRKDAEYTNRDNIVGSFSSFCRIFPVQMKDTYVTKNGVPYIQWTFTGPDALRSIDGEALKKYLLDHFGDVLFTSNGVRNICPLTGYYADYMILNPIYEFLASPSSTLDYELLMDACVDAWCVLCNKDLEQFYSMESFLHQCEANDYKFLKNGRMF
jgi:hypothetical protein